MRLAHRLLEPLFLACLVQPGCAADETSADGTAQGGAFTGGTSASSGGAGGTAGTAGKGTGGTQDASGGASSAGSAGKSTGGSGPNPTGGAPASGAGGGPDSGGVSAASGAAGAGGETGESGAPGTASCAPLAETSGTVIEVTPGEADDLPSIVRDAPAGATIALADGTYTMSGRDESSRRIQIVSEGLTLRSSSGDRDAVVIDGEYLTEEIVTISASNVTLADLRIERAVNHPIHVTGGPAGDIVGTRLHNLHIVDGGEQFVKINTGGSDPLTYADDGVVECSLFELTDEGRENVEPEPGGCYTGGIDGHQARGWVVRANVFRGIHCTNGSLAEHAIHFWTASRDTLVEQNTIIDCARGIGFGLGDGGGAAPERAYADDPYPGVGYVGHYDGVVRNNVIAISPGFSYFDTGIELEQARGTRVLHNSIVHPESAFASISHRFANSLVTLENNLVQSIRARDGSVAEGDSNLENASDDLFVDVAGHDLHLVPGASAAIDQGVALDDAGEDIDGEAHDTGEPDLGADELAP